MKYGVMTAQEIQELDERAKAELAKHSWKPDARVKLTHAQYQFLQTGNSFFGMHEDFDMRPTAELVRHLCNERLEAVKKAALLRLRS